MAKQKKDYTKFSTQPEAPVVETVVEEVAEQIAEDIVETPAEPKAVFGIVTDCLRLNVRKNPNLNSTVVTVITADADVTINEEESTKDFYKVCTANGVEGYCMKKFITIKP